MFKINQIVFDSENKEYVKLSNGTDAGGKFVPTEAVAVRIIGFNEENKPIVAFTYRKVNPEKLTTTFSETNLFEMIRLEKPIHFEYIGRV